MDGEKDSAAPVENGPAWIRERGLIFRLNHKIASYPLFIQSAKSSFVARLEFTGRDTAAGKSFETWVKKYQAKKAAGETDIRIDPEKLD